MTTRTEIERRRIIESGSPLQRKTSLSQRNLSKQTVIEGKVFRSNNIKAKKAEERRKREEDFIKKILPRQQFDRCLTHIMNGGATVGNILYVLQHIGGYEQTVQTENGLEITIVDFTGSEIE